MFLSKILPYLGLGSWLLMVLAVLTGRHIIKAKLSVHKSLAIVAIAIATIHGLIFVYLNYF